MILSRENLYGVGMPAAPGQHYRAFIRFARRHIGRSALDLGCGFGAYGAELARTGVECVGCDVNPEYLRTAKAGLPVVQVDSALPFADRSFDSVLMFEVIEHVEDLERILNEAFRVARKNVLITVPNSENIEQMKANDVTYAHMLSTDHVHFFDPESLQLLLKQYAKDVVIERSDPIYPFWFIGRSLPFYALKLIFQAGLLRPRFFSRLYAVASVREN